ncbi:MAG TPA: thioredoxin-dependent thiol peroxidase [Hyphomicrobiales bacterium]|nr:thioredoxin-dependent thiol peroxidase [Hyphomicrobiales bacterium]
MAKLEAGAKAPEFRLPTDDGGEIRLADLRGKKVVLYFYPKDDTSGCTMEAKDFTRLAPDFRSRGIAVIGVSPDSAQSHRKFKDKYALDLVLAADDAKKVVQDYGVWAEKSMYGRNYMGVERTTFLIDADGRIERVWPKVKVAGHAEEVLAAASAA